jgi:molybdate transport system substrate-binding protein
VARNALTLIVPEASRLELRGPEDLGRAEVQRVALGNPKTVPAGQYAEECLRSLGLWDTLRPKLIFAENVRQVLEYVARGESGCGICLYDGSPERPGTVKGSLALPSAATPPSPIPGRWSSPQGASARAHIHGPGQR